MRVAVKGSRQQRQLLAGCSLATAALQQALSSILEVLAAAAVAALKHAVCTDAAHQLPYSNVPALALAAAAVVQRHTAQLMPAVCLLAHLPFWFRSIDYPVKWFVVVVGEQVAAGKNAIAYEVKHLLEYPQDKVGERAAQYSVWCSAARVDAARTSLICVFALALHVFVRPQQRALTASHPTAWWLLTVLCFDQILTPAAPSLCGGLCAAGIVVITCEQQPSVSESWNAIFQMFKEEPFGVYMARDTFWCVAQAWAGSLLPSAELDSLLDASTLFLGSLGPHASLAAASLFCGCAILFGSGAMAHGHSHAHNGYINV